MTRVASPSELRLLSRRLSACVPRGGVTPQQVRLSISHISLRSAPSRARPPVARVARAVSEVRVSPLAVFLLKIPTVQLAHLPQALSHLKMHIEHRAQTTLQVSVSRDAAAGPTVTVTGEVTYAEFDLTPWTRGQPVGRFRPRPALLSTVPFPAASRARRSRTRARPGRSPTRR